MGLDGYVQNRWDGSVEAVFEGERSTIETCIEWNKTSQPYARVESVEVSWSEPNGEFHGFRALRQPGGTAVRASRFGCGTSSQANRGGWTKPARWSESL